MQYIRCYADAAGASHYEDVAVEGELQNYAPPAPPFELSVTASASGYAFARFPVGWYGDWHPTPRRQFFIFLEGEFEGETSDGERRSHGPGSVVLLEDTIGRGHRARVTGDSDVLAMVVQLPD